MVVRNCLPISFTFAEKAFCFLKWRTNFLQNAYAYVDGMFFVFSPKANNNVLCKVATPMR